ncbi:MAG: hypothetical protein CL823_01905 [Crocinitomicaceae bacterium]|nr:hypothetical protein [Crocinitomicaceae bacterium]|tara:strand:+ start:4663 stop:5766 length:1104 start_codon:yes stop_codon:yes gene_type:complete
MKKSNIFLIIVACILSVYSCTKETTEGPNLEDFYADLTIIDSLSLTNYNPNFGLEDTVGFSAQFSKSVSWVITITGTNSNKSIEFYGTDSLITPQEISWFGDGAYNSPFNNDISLTGELSSPFFEEEMCLVELTFEDEENSNISMVDSLTIEGLKQIEGILVADFEEGLPNNSCTWEQAGGSMTFDIANDEALESGSYYKMGGIVGWDWVLGAIDIPLDISDVTSNPNDFFLNLGILSGDVQGNFADNQFINIMISEEQNTPFNDDLSNNLSDVFASNMEVYQYKIQPVDWVGWQYKGIAYSEFEEKNVDVPGVTYSRNPNNITAIRIQCQACPWNASTACPNNENIAVRTDVDYIIFTENTSILNQ